MDAHAARASHDRVRELVGEDRREEEEGRDHRDAPAHERAPVRVLRREQSGAQVEDHEPEHDREAPVDPDLDSPEPSQPEPWLAPAGSGRPPRGLEPLARGLCARPPERR
jgi:hypothetical protein